MLHAAMQTLAKGLLLTPVLLLALDAQLISVCMHKSSFEYILCVRACESYCLNCLPSAYTDSLES